MVQFIDNILLLAVTHITFYDSTAYSCDNKLGWKKNM